MLVATRWNFLSSRSRANLMLKTCSQDAEHEIIGATKILRSDPEETAGTKMSARTNRRNRRAQPLAVAGVLLAASLALALASCATPGAEAETGSEAESSAEAPADSLQVDEIAEGTQASEVDVEIAGPAQVNFREITIPPGVSTGEHCHYGNLIGVVKQGTLTHYAPIYPDGVHEYQTGDSLVEGSGYVHEGRNEGTEDVILWVTYITPVGDVLAEPDLAKCDTASE